MIGYSIVANESIWISCPQCRGDQRGFPGGLCEDCGNTGEVGEDISDLMTLAHNLAIGAALCRAFTIGGAVGIDSFTGVGLYQWRPGCGRGAP